MLVPLAIAALLAGTLPAERFTAAFVSSIGFVIGAALIDVAVHRARFRWWFPYATVTFDVVLVSASAIASTLYLGVPTRGIKSPFISLYFLILVFALLRQTPRLSLYAGAVTATGYLSLLIPVALSGGPVFIREVDDEAAAGVSFARVSFMFVMLLACGSLGAVGALRARRLVARALDTITFLFADLRDYTPFLETRGDAAGAALVAEYRRIVRAEIARTGGRELKTEGDSFLVAFGSARQALDCAIGILRTAHATRESRPDLPLEIGIGLNAGEPAVQDNDYVGLAVNVAARLGQQARAGELLITEIVRGLVRTGDAPPMERRTDLTLKGIADQPTVFTVLWGPASPR